MQGVRSARDRGAISGGGHITLKVKSKDGNEVFFRIKRSTQLKKLMNGYCVRQSVDFDTVAFLFDDLRLRGEQTPEQLGLEDGDEIDAMLRHNEVDQPVRRWGKMSYVKTRPPSGGGHMTLKVRGRDETEKRLLTTVEEMRQHQEAIVSSLKRIGQTLKKAEMKLLNWGCH